MRIAAARCDSTGADRRRPSSRSRLDAPLEALVEAEAVRAGPAGARVAAELGQVLLRPAAAPPGQVAHHLRATSPVGLPPTTVSTRPAGAAWSCWRAQSRRRRRSPPRVDPRPRAEPPSPTGRAAATRNGRRRRPCWLPTRRGAFVEPGGQRAWAPTDGVRFSSRDDGVGGPADGDEYGGGRRWSHFDCDRDRPADDAGRATAAWRPAPRAAPLPRHARLPVLGVRGARGVLRRHRGRADDLAGSPWPATACSYGDDWYMAPLRVPSGSLAQIVKVEVIDDFGRTTTVEPAASDGGRTAPFASSS